MARINTNVSALAAQRGLAKSQRQLNDTLQRLSSGLRINRGADDPAGLIVSEGLRSEMAGISQAIDNSERASNVIATAEANLSEIASLLLNIKELVVEAANTGALSKEEIDANQLQINSAIDSITRISNTATFAGLRLLNGSLDYVTSGVNTAEIKSLRVQQANFGSQPFMPVRIDVLTSAKTASLAFKTSQITSSLTLKIEGPEGVDELKFVSGTNASAIAFAVNRVLDSTGVKVDFINPANTASGIVFRSESYGSRSFVSIKSVGGAFATYNDANVQATRDTGEDAVATINGALTLGDGLNIKLTNSSLNLELTLDKAFGTGQTQFAVTGGGAKFQLGPQVTTNQQVSMGIQSVAASKLGDDEVGFLADLISGGNASLAKGGAGNASKIIEKAIRQVAVIRGRLGAFEKNTLQTNAQSLSVALENVTASESSIRDADFAAETSALTRAQILTQAGTSVLATANSTPQSVLSLLQG